MAKRDVPIIDTSWIVVRHPHAFLPEPWRTVLCMRDMEIEVIMGIQERRSRFTLDSHTGAEWHREGSGQYEVWSHIPPWHQWCPLALPPPIGRQCLFWLSGSPHRGLQIGQVTIQHPDMRRYQIRHPMDCSWMTVVSKAIGGWLLLPVEDDLK
ncbi:MAG: hypothetical protein HC812_09085 [Leptolyngbya sp. RL_3_1]|nr:hypothetical protein [Leptolyngbya sp. RL_3_1]